MWTCPKCQRVFSRKDQPHSCKSVPLKIHFKGKEKAKDIFDLLVKKIEEKIGQVKIISIPCCVHLFGRYDFLAAFPKRNSLEIRIALNRKADSKRLTNSVSLSSVSFKNCFEISSEEEVDKELLNWIKEAYFLK